MIRRVLVVLALLVGFFAVAAPAHAGTYPFSCGFILNPPVVAAGATEVHIQGSGFTPGSQQEFFMAPVGNAAAQVSIGFLQVDSDPDGNVDGFLPIPPQFQTDGEYEVSTICDDGNIATNILIVGQGSPTSLAPLPVTGSSNTLPLLRIAAGLVALGALVLVLSRPRRRARARAGA